MLAAVAATPPGSFNDVLAAAFLLSNRLAKADANPRDVSASATTYRWALLGPRERRILNLDPDAEKDKQRSKDWHGRRRRRAKGDPVLHPTRKWLIYSRKNTDDIAQQRPIDYYLLVKNLPTDQQVTEKELSLECPLSSDVPSRSDRDDQGRSRPPEGFYQGQRLKVFGHRP